MPTSPDPDASPDPGGRPTRLVDRVVAEGKRRRRRSSALAGGLAVLVVVALAVPLTVHLSRSRGRSTIGLAAGGNGAAGTDTSPTAIGGPSSAAGGPGVTATIGPPAGDPGGSGATPGSAAPTPPPHALQRSTTSVTPSPPAGTGNAGLTVHVTASAIGNLGAHVRVVADDPDHTLPALRWGPACSGWSVDFGESGTQVACPMICQAGSATPAPPPSPGHVDAAVDHTYGGAGTYTVTVRYVVMCGAAASDPTLSGGTATAIVTVT